MRKVAVIFLIVQILDILLTLLGISLGLAELNPLVNDWGKIISVKLVAVLCITIILQIKRPSKLDWLLVIISGPVVLWNLINIFIEVCH